ncbi:Outer membrane lipoprotein-sorting protein [Sulfidibacter corallicola]|uniref:Outer membrane lipoprotein-sorting protein n=1 Tax=Sulfidibacter corallicola TaxID=2818388 RepID=A0A8A4TI52_SULCO|nr:outer membrane lipoprotein-sorting protein [Sulfidibacter corallicola]QTD48511.1 outer membrane lipoprotein-sorting protein [Sulfidibacter corallicola]
MNFRGFSIPLLSLVLFLTLLQGLPLLAETPEEKGLRIAQLNESKNDGFKGEYAEMVMVLINAHGDKVERKMTTKTRETNDDGDQSISVFLWPADVKGTKMLTWTHKDDDDDQWLYMPALKRVKRISSRNKSGAFMGSEFAYEDLGSQEVEKYHHKFIEETTLDGREIWKMERVPTSKKSGYSKQITYVDKEYHQPLRIEYFDRKGDLMKIATFRDYREMGDFWRVHEIDMDNVQTKKRSIITWSTREIGKKYSEYDFESDSLVN